MAAGIRARQRTAVPADQSDPRALLHATLEEFLPLDRERRAGLTVLTACYAGSLTGPALAAVFLAEETTREDLVATLITAAGSRPGVGPAHQADLLVSGVTGPGPDLLHRRRDGTGVRRIVDRHRERILSP